MPNVEPALERRYNDDLLASEADRNTINLLFPEIYHVLDHPQLREEFVRYNTMADKAKGLVHLLGLSAIAMATLAPNGFSGLNA